MQKCHHWCPSFTCGGEARMALRRQTLSVSRCKWWHLRAASGALKLMLLSLMSLLLTSLLLMSVLLMFGNADLECVTLQRLGPDFVYKCDQHRCTVAFLMKCLAPNTASQSGLFVRRNAKEAGMRELGETVLTREMLRQEGHTVVQIFDSDFRGGTAKQRALLAAALQPALPPGVPAEPALEQADSTAAAELGDEQLSTHDYSTADTDVASLSADEEVEHRPTQDVDAVPRRDTDLHAAVSAQAAGAVDSRDVVTSVPAADQVGARHLSPASETQAAADVVHAPSARQSAATDAGTQTSTSSTNRGGV